VDCLLLGSFGVNTLSMVDIPNLLKWGILKADLTVGGDENIIDDEDGFGC